MSRQQSRIKEREAEIRRRQPKIEKMIMRSRCILSECSKFSLDERMVVAAHLATIISRLREPILQTKLDVH